MDESGLCNRFTVVGGICLRSARIPEVHASIQRFREEHNMRTELKWTKISDNKLAQYEALIDYFFALNNNNHLQFSCDRFRQPRRIRCGLVRQR